MTLGHVDFMLHRIDAYYFSFRVTTIFYSLIHSFRIFV